VGYQVPNGKWIFIGLDVTQWDNLERSEPVLMIEAKDNRVNRGIVSLAAAAEHAEPGGTGAMIKLNIVLPEPVLIKVQREAAQQDGQNDHDANFSRHTAEGLTWKMEKYSTPRSEKHF